MDFSFPPLPFLLFYDRDGPGCQQKISRPPPFFLFPFFNETLATGPGQR